MSPPPQIWILSSFAFKSFVTQVGYNNLLHVETKRTMLRLKAIYLDFQLSHCVCRVQ